MYEYKTLKVNNVIKFDAELNAHAEQGWEVIGFGHSTGFSLALLKREKSDDV